MMPTDEELLQGARDEIALLRRELEKTALDIDYANKRADKDYAERVKAEAARDALGKAWTERPMVQEIAALTGRAEKAEAILRRALPILREFAKDNPPIHYDGGSKLDPRGVHALLADWPGIGC